MIYSNAKLRVLLWTYQTICPTINSWLSIQPSSRNRPNYSMEWCGAHNIQRVPKSYILDTIRLMDVAVSSGEPDPQTCYSPRILKAYMHHHKLYFSVEFDPGWGYLVQWPEMFYSKLQTGLKSAYKISEAVFILKPSVVNLNLLYEFKSII